MWYFTLQQLRIQSQLLSLILLHKTTSFIRGQLLQLFVIDRIFLFLNVQIINIYNWVDISAAELPTASIELREARRQRCKS